MILVHYPDSELIQVRSQAFRGTNDFSQYAFASLLSTVNRKLQREAKERCALAETIMKINEDENPHFRVGVEISR